MLTGAKLAEETTAFLTSGGSKLPVVVLPFCHDMPAAYASADLAVARAGASTLSELALCGVPAVLVPYPFAADDHQTANARAMVSAGAARLLPEAELSGAGLGAVMDELLENPDPFSQMARAMRSLSAPHAAEAMALRIAESIP